MHTERSAPDSSSPADPADRVAAADARARGAAADFDSALHAAVMRHATGLSPISLALAQADWLLHLATQPAQSLRLAMAAQRDRKSTRLNSSHLKLSRMPSSA